MDKSNLIKRINQLPQTDSKDDPRILKSRKTIPRSYIAWCEEEDQILSELYGSENSVSSIATLLKRSRGAIEKRIVELDLFGNTKAAQSNHLKKSNNSQSNESAHKKTSENKTDTVHKILKYWRNSLADADKMGLSPSKVKQGELFELQQLKAGELPREKIERLFRDAEKERKKGTKKRSHNKDALQEEFVINKLAVIITPYTVKKKYEHAKKIAGDRSPNELFPLWIVAVLTRDGKLHPSEEQVYPWIERKCLTPNEENKDCAGFPILGDVADTDKFYTKKSDLFSEGKCTWGSIFSYAENLFLSLVDKDKDIFVKQEFSLFEEGYVLPAKDILEASKGIITTYDQYLKGKEKEIPRILKQFCSLKAQPKEADLPDKTLFMAGLMHLGQMQMQYPLSKSQRVSINYFLHNKNNNIFTIHGPPGTGKTTLLLTVIASHWIEAALAKKPPTILVVASTNNLAVLNILDQFKKIGCVDSQSQTSRWLLDFDSYGLYLAPSHRAEEAGAKGYPYRLKKEKFCSHEKLYTGEYRIKAKKHFLSQYNHCYQKNETELIHCRQFIREEMLAKHSLMDKTLNFAVDAYSLIVEVEERYGGLDALNKLIQDNQRKKDSVAMDIKALKTLRADWFAFKTEQLRWLTLFSWLPFVKSLLLDRVKLFTSKHHDIFPDVIERIDNVENLLEEVINNKTELCNNFQKELDALYSYKEKYKQFHQEKIILENQLGFEILLENVVDYSSPTNIQCKLDLSLRYELFILATHYWEVYWLLESEALESLHSSREDVERYWQIQAMLTPCFVTTLHSGTGFFQYKAPSQSFKTLADFIDLLIIDEAGQVMPAIAGGMMSVAKRALFVGDDKQIEPIYSLTEGIDLANAKRYGLCVDEHNYESLKTKGILCSGDPHTGHAYGNLVVVGQRQSTYRLENHPVPGMLLREHRRCAKEIISYCNELCYNNQLLPMTAERPSIYPRMGYAHIKGFQEPSGSSRCNKLEAEAIVTWIIKNKDKILETSQETTLDDCIGIITPFAAQAKVLKSLLYLRGLNLKKVGTIHTLQGAEKPIIIFSPVYTADKNQGRFFFDQSANMLNVAVSRAKQSFLVFGDIDIFDPNKGKLPSSLLARYLFASEENEIVDIVQPKFRYITDGDKVSQLNTLEKHQKALRRAFERVHHELNIVSPFLRKRAITLDKIPALISECRSNKNASINIYTDPTLNRNNDEEFKGAISVLKQAGAKVYLVNNVHSKIITIDNDIIIEGSFNWLSASREGPYVREESSIIYMGTQVPEFIKKAMEPVQAKVQLTREPCHL